MRLHAKNIGIKPKRILVTGGASKNSTITNVLSNVMGVEVFAL